MEAPEIRAQAVVLADCLRRARVHGLASGCLSILCVLRVKSDARTGFLAKFMGIKPSGVTSLVDALVAKQLCERRSTGQDLRLSLHNITEKGRQTIEEILGNGA